MRFHHNSIRRQKAFVSPLAIVLLVLASFAFETAAPSPSVRASSAVTMVQTISCFNFSNSLCTQSFYFDVTAGDVVVVNVWLWGYRDSGCGNASVSGTLGETYVMQAKSGCDNFLGDSMNVQQFSAMIPASDFSDTITVTNSIYGSGVVFFAYDVSGIGQTPTCTGSAYSSGTSGDLPISVQSSCPLPQDYFATAIARIAPKFGELTAGTEEGWPISQCQYSNIAASEWATSGLTSPTTFRFDGTQSSCKSESSESYADGFVLVGGVYPPAGGIPPISSSTTTSAAETVTTTVTVPPSPITNYSSTDITLLGLAFAIAASGISIGIGLGRKKPA